MNLTPSFALRGIAVAMTLLLTLAVIGCSPPDAPPTDDPPPSSGDDDDSATGEVTVTIADIDAYNEVLAKHKGNVVLIDFWADWCIPCKKKFPHIVELAEKHHDAGLRLVTVSLDDPESIDVVKEYLVSQNATGDNLISHYGGGTEAMEKFDLEGQVPYYKLIGRKGEVREVFAARPDEPVTIEAIEAKIEELLAEEG